MGKIILLLGIILCFLNNPIFAEQDQPLKIFLKLEGDAYEVGENIPFSLYFYNAGDRPLKIYNPEYPGVTTLTVIDAEGLPQIPQKIKLPPLKMEKFFIIPPGQKIVQEHNHLRWFSSEGPVEFSGPAQLTPSVYRVLIKIHMPPAGALKEYRTGDVWQGDLATNVVQIKVFEKGKTLLDCRDCRSKWE